MKISAYQLINQELETPQKKFFFANSVLRLFTELQTTSTLNQFSTIVPLLYPLKISENLTF